MVTQMDTAKHEIVLIEKAHLRPLMGLGNRPRLTDSDLPTK